MALPLKNPLPAQFPKKQVEAELRNWWNEQEQARNRRGHPFADASAQSNTVFGIQPQVSSQEAVAILTRLKPLLGFEPSKSAIRKGGYSGVEDMVTNFLPRVEKQFSKKQ